MILVTNYNAIDSSLRFKRHMSVENCYFLSANLMIQLGSLTLPQVVKSGPLPDQGPRR